MCEFWLHRTLCATKNRGCSFVQKAFHAEEAGAMVAIIYDNDENNDS